MIHVRHVDVHVYKVKKVGKSNYISLYKMYCVIYITIHMNQRLPCPETCNRLPEMVFYKFD